MSRKDWLKIRTGKLWENQSLSNLAFAVFSFQIALKLKCIIFFKVTKIAFFPKKKTQKLFNGGMGTLPSPQNQGYGSGSRKFLWKRKKGTAYASTIFIECQNFKELQLFKKIYDEK